jgi:hypothetical protein
MNLRSMLTDTIAYVELGRRWLSLVEPAGNGASRNT